MAGVPYIFGNATTSIPLSNLDADFNTPVTIGNTTVGLGNTVTTLGNVTLNNVTITSGTINASVTEAYSNANAIVYANASKVGTTNANLTYDGTTFTAVNDASISGLTVGKGAGSQVESTVLGSSSLGGSNTGSQNTAIGYSILNANTSGNGNTGIGSYALRYNTTGYNNFAGGVQALQANTTGGLNVSVGFQSLYSNTTASNNTAVGYQAAYSNQTGPYITALGYRAAYYTTSGNLTAVGVSALQSNTTGTSNTAVGGYDNNISAALFSNTTGSFNIAVGTGALQANTTASINTAVGYQAAYNNTTASGNTAVGYQSLYTTNATNMTAVGYQALLNAGANGDSTALGYQAGYNLTTGYRGLYLGAGTVASAVGAISETVVGYGLTGKGSNTAYVGGSSGAYQQNNSAAWSITSDARLKKNIVDNTIGLSAITAIQVRNFEYRTANEITELESQNAVDIQGVQLGAIAQEIQAILPDCVKTESTGVMSVDTTNLTWYLINAVKELKAEVDSLKQQLGK